LRLEKFDCGDERRTLDAILVQVIRMATKKRGSLVQHVVVSV
jgi:hypothetical protein